MEAALIPRVPFLRALGLSAALLLLGALAARAVTPTEIERVSLTSAEEEPNNDSFGPLEITSDGRYVLFTSSASNMYQRTSNSGQDVYVRDRKIGFTTLVSRADSTTAKGAFANGSSDWGSISDDGRFVAFASAAGNLNADTAGKPIDTNNASDVFLRDLRGGSTIPLSRATDGKDGDGISIRPRISGDGRWVVFESTSTNLVAGDANKQSDIFLVELTQDFFSGPVRVLSRQRISTDAAGVEATNDSHFPSISNDGQFVAFQSSAENLVTGDTNKQSDIFVKNTLTGEVQLISQAAPADDGTPGVQGDGSSTVPMISGDGRFVAFVSDATNLVGDDTNGKRDVFVKDRETGAIERVSVSDDGTEGDADSSPANPGPNGRGTAPFIPAISDDGNLVMFASDATNLALDDNNLMTDVFVRDRAAGTTTRLSASTSGLEGDAASGDVALSGDGSLAAFTSRATNLIPADGNSSQDVFLVRIGTGGLVNEPPVADAGPDQDVNEGDPVVLDASATTDVNGDALTYSWKQIGGTDKVTLDDPTSPTPTFIAPLVASFEDLQFQLTVSDGINPVATDTVTVTVSTAPPATLTGTVKSNSGNPVVDATVDVVRSDGQAATQVHTNGIGAFSVTDIRVGANTVTIRSPRFEPLVQQITFAAGETVDQNFVLSSPLASIQGNVLLSDGRPLVGATVELLSGQGDVVGTSQTDSGGEYRIIGLDRFQVQGGVTVRITHPSAIEWDVSNVQLTESTDNIRNFQYGNLDVTVTARPNNLRKKLNGTRVDILIGDAVVASNVASARVRVLHFSNVPATLLRVRASNRNLTGAVVSTTVPAGRGPKRVTLTLRRRGIF
jgi:hypothetical protein